MNENADIQDVVGNEMPYIASPQSNVELSNMECDVPHVPSRKNHERAEHRFIN